MNFTDPIGTSKQSLGRGSFYKLPCQNMGSACSSALPRPQWNKDSEGGEVSEQPDNQNDNGMKLSLFGGLTFRATAPLTSAETGLRGAAGTEEGGFGVSVSFFLNTTLAGAGASLGRGVEGGIFPGDISEIKSAGFYNLDTAVGGVSFLNGKDGNGLAVGGPSPILGVSAYESSLPGTSFNASAILRVRKESSSSNPNKPSNINPNFNF